MADAALAVIKLAKQVHSLCIDAKSTKRTIKSVGENMLIIQSVVEQVRAADDVAGRGLPESVVATLDEIHAKIGEVKEIVIRAHRMPKLVYVLSARGLNEEIVAVEKDIHLRLTTLEVGRDRNSSLMHEIRTELQLQWDKWQTNLNNARKEEQIEKDRMLTGDVAANARAAVAELASASFSLEDENTALRDELEELRTKLDEITDSVVRSKARADQEAFEQVIAALTMAAEETPRQHEEKPPKSTDDSTMPNVSICSISRNVMVNPVTLDCSCSHSFEETAINQWLKRSRICPKCRCSVRSGEVKPNYDLRNAIEEFADSVGYDLPPASWLSGDAEVENQVDVDEENQGQQHQEQNQQDVHGQDVHGQDVHEQDVHQEDVHQQEVHQQEVHQHPQGTGKCSCIQKGEDGRRSPSARCILYCLPILLIAVVIAVGVAFKPDDPSQCLTQLKLVPKEDDGAASDWFGASIAFDGDTVVVGAPGPFPDSEIPGYVHVYTRGDTSSGSSTWTLQAKLVANDGATDDRFGTSVAIHGSTIVVGAAYDDTDDDTDDVFNPHGSAYVFIRDGSGTSANWTQQARLVAEDGAADDYFGTSVAVHGDTIVVGADGDDTVNGTNSGSAYVYTRAGTGTSANWTQQAKLIAGDGAAGDNFGTSVAIYGGTIVIGADYDETDNGIANGSAYVYTRNGSGMSAKFTQQAKLVAEDGGADDRFGFSVAIHGNTIVVGANRDDTDNGEDSGSAYVYTRAGTGTSAKWTQQAKLVAEDGATGDWFGTSVAIHGDTIVVGAEGDDTDSGVNSGSAYVYTRAGTGPSANWTQQAKVVAKEDNAFFDGFGESVAIRGGTIVVGASDVDTDNGWDSGSAYVFDFC